MFMILATLFFLPTTKELTGNTDLATITGYEGIICGLTAVYNALAEVPNEMYGKTVLSI